MLEDGSRLQLVAADDGTDCTFDEQWQRFWALTAERMTRALTTVSPDHPEIAVLRQVVRDARAAARLPAAWS